MEIKIMNVCGVKSKGLKRRPRIRLSGDWLEKIGFESGKLVVAKYEYGSIILQAHDSDKYRNVVKGAFKAGAGLFQVHRGFHNKKWVSSITITGFRLEPLGFTIGSVIAVRSEYGFIKIMLINLDKLDL